MAREWWRLIMPVHLDPSINDWWVRPNNSNDAAAAAGFRTGVQRQENQMDRAERAIDRQDRNSYNDEALRLKALDQSSEQKRVGLAIKQYEAKTLTETMQGQGLTELNTFLSAATAADKLTDPKTESEFFNLTSRWAPYIPQTTVNSIYDNTFKAAKDRKAMAERAARVGQNAPAIVATDKAAADLDLQADELEAKDPEAAGGLRTRAEGIRNAARLTPAATGAPETGEFDLPDGRKISYYREGGKIKTFNPPKDNMSDLERVEYTTELRALQAKYADGDLKSDEFDKKREELHKRFRATKRPTSGVDPNNPLGLDLNLKQ
jgi:hypothetical protein